MTIFAARMLDLASEFWQLWNIRTLASPETNVGGLITKTTHVLWFFETYCRIEA